MATRYGLIPDRTGTTAQGPFAGIRGTVHNGLIVHQKTKRGSGRGVPDDSIHVSETGFEPVAPCVSSRCSDRAELHGQENPR